MSVRFGNENRLTFGGLIWANFVFATGLFIYLGVHFRALDAKVEALCGAEAVGPAAFTVVPNVTETPD